jgi:hypothetical protein
MVRQLDRVDTKVPPLPSLGPSLTSSLSLTRYRLLLNHHGDNDDGLFWISFEDFCKHYRTIDYCRLVNLPGWRSHLLTSAWLPNQGGRMSLSQSFLQNPQFFLAVASSSSSVKCQVSVVLSQHELRDSSSGDRDGRVDAEEEIPVDYKSLYVFRLHDLPQQPEQTQPQPRRLTEVPRSKQILKKFDSFQNARDISIEFQVHSSLCSP